MTSMPAIWFLAGVCLTSPVAKAPNGRSARIEVGPEVCLGGDTNRSQWEASLVVSRKDPKRLLVSCMVDPPPDLLRLLRPMDKREKHTCMAFCSKDGGATWLAHEFPRADLFDPVVAFGPDGSAYLAYMYPELGPSTLIGVHQSDDCGQSWKPRVQLSEKGENADHPMIVIDHTGGKFAGRVYVGAYGKNGVLVYYSSDSGRTFQTVAAVPDWSNKHVYVHNMLVLSDGTLFVPLAEAQTAKRDARGRPIDPSVVFSSIVSTDGGVTFSKPRKMTDEIKTVKRGPWGVSNVVCAVGRHKGKDRLYALWSEKREGGGQMRLIHSDDAGVTWSPPRDVTANPPQASEHGACNIAVSWDGMVGVSWLNHEPSGKYDTWFTASTDGGMSFLPPVKLSRKNSQTPSWQERPFPGDDYMLMDGGPDGTFHVIWPDARTGIAYQIYTCKVKLSQPGG